MRRKWVILLVLAAAVILPVAVWAATDRYNGNVDRQRAKFRTANISTSSTAWHDVPVFSAEFCSLNEVSATLSVTLREGRARFRMVGQNGNVIMPGVAEFAPNGVESFSYTFVGNTRPAGGDNHHSFKIQWRSTTGKKVVLRHGVVNFLYELGVC